MVGRNPQVLANGKAQSLRRKGVRIKHGHHARFQQVERAREHSPQQVVLAGDVVVEASTVHPEGLAQVLHARGVEAAGPEETRRGREQVRFPRPLGADSCPWRRGR